MSQRVAAVVVTYNRLDKLKKVLDSLLSQTTPAEWIVIVDNASTDGTKEYLESLNEPSLDVTYLDENTGGAGGFATGMKRGYDLGADFVWVMDDDCYPYADCLENLVTGFNSAHDTMPAGVPWACSLIMHEEDEIAEMNIAPAEWKWAHLLVKQQQAVLVHTCSFVSALYPRETLERIGLPFREYFIWFDDAAYAKLACRGIGPGVCVLNSRAFHDTPTNYAPDFASIDDGSLWKFEYGTRNEGSFHLHHENFISYLRFAARVEILMHRGRLPWKTRRKITKKLLQAIPFNPKAERVTA